MAAWPSTLPNPSFDGYSVEAGDPTIRTDMDSGPARVRRRFTAAPDRVGLKFVMTEAQMSAFRTFWDGDAMQGAAWFDMTLRDGRMAGVVSKAIRPNPAAFKAEMLGAGVWSVTFSAEVRNA